MEKEKPYMLRANIIEENNKTSSPREVLHQI